MKQEKIPGQKLLTLQSLIGLQNPGVRKRIIYRMIDTRATVNQVKSAECQELEILNPIGPKETPKEKFNIGGSGSIALPKYYENFKAIHYYTDDEDEYFYKPNRHFD